MSNTEQPNRIDLTEEQKQEVKDAAAAEGSALEAPVEELEQRITPTLPTESVTLSYGTIRW